MLFVFVVCGQSCVSGRCVFFVSLRVAGRCCLSFAAWCVCCVLRVIVLCVVWCSLCAVCCYLMRCMCWLVCVACGLERCRLFIVC